MFEEFNRLPNFYQGVLCFGVGLIVMLYSLGLFGKGITIVIMLLGLYLMFVGCVKIGLVRKVADMLSKK